MSNYYCPSCLKTQDFNKKENKYNCPECGYILYENITNTIDIIALNNANAILNGELWPPAAKEKAEECGHPCTDKCKGRCLPKPRR